MTSVMALKSPDRISTLTAVYTDQCYLATCLSYGAQFSGGSLYYGQWFCVATRVLVVAVGLFRGDTGPWFKPTHFAITQERHSVKVAFCTHPGRQSDVLWRPGEGFGRGPREGRW